MDDQPKELRFRSTNRPTAKARKYDILRVPGVGAGNLVLLGHEFLWHDLHYWRGRSTPCFGEGCEPCEHNCQVRERGYIAITPRNKIDVMILEVTDQCGEVIAGEHEKLVTIRGQVVGLSRMEKKSNGRLAIEFSGQCIDAKLLPESPDVAEIMRRIWGMGKRKSMTTAPFDLPPIQTIRCGVQQPSTNGTAG